MSDVRLSPRLREALAAAAVFLVALGIYVPTVATAVVNTDVAANSLTAWQIAHTGRPWMDGLNLNEAGVVDHYSVNADGRDVTSRTPGQILVAVPAYLGSSDSQEDVSWGPSGVTAALLTAAAVTLFFLSLRRRLTLRPALAASAVLAFTTPMWTVSADALWTHPVTVLACAGAAWGLSRDRYVPAGLFLAFGILARPHIALIALVVGLGMAWQQRRLRPAVEVGLSSALGMVLLVAWNRWVFGAWDIRSGYGQSFETAVPGARADYLTNLAGFLVSPDRGMLIWTPLLLVLAPLALARWRSLPAWSQWLAVGGVTYQAVQLSLNVFHGGDAFWGYRLGLEMLVCIAPALAFAAEPLSRSLRVAAAVLVSLQFAMMAVGSRIDRTFYLYVADDDVWRDNNLIKVLRDGATGYLLVFVAAWLLALSVIGLLSRVRMSTLHGDHEPELVSESR